MPSIFTLTGSDDAAPTKNEGLGANKKRCVCKRNKRTKRGVLLCFIGKGARTPNGKITRSGWLIRGACSNPER